MEQRMKRFMDLMNMEVRPEDVTCEEKVFFKTYSSFHLVTARDGFFIDMLVPWILSRFGM